MLLMEVVLEVCRVEKCEKKILYSVWAKWPTVAAMRQRDGGFQVGMAGLAQTGGICDYTLDLAHRGPSENNARQLLQAQFQRSLPGRRCLDACINISIG